MKEKQEKYNIGLDIGTNSVGWAVLDENNHLISFRKKNMWGSRLFEAGETAMATRIKRSTRRRYNRRRERISFLREIMSPIISNIDENFFKRLDEAFLYLEDKTVESKHILFEDENFTDSDYYNKYKTIYHLRKALINDSEKADPRLIYLALHHIIKYRGHFLYQGQKFETISGDFTGMFRETLNEIKEKCDIDLNLDLEEIEDIEKELHSTRNSKKQKQENIIGIILNNDNDIKYVSEFVKAVLGYTADFSVLFCDNEILDDSGKALKLSFSDSKYEEKESDIIESLQGKDTVLELIKKIYSWVTLQGILQGKSTIADAMVDKYEKHQSDLVLLKALIKKYAFDQYSLFFRKELDEKGKYIKNYVNYIAGEKRCSQEDLYKSIKVILKGLNDLKFNTILFEMEEGKFLPLLNTKENSAIPYQLNEFELSQIIDIQGKYYPLLAENKEKIISIFKFKIPYYVGPMNSNSKFAWLERGKDKIYPWNYTDVIDIDATAENFIKRMTNKCTYFNDQDVIPKNSLLYSRYMLLNEMNKIRVNGKLIPAQDKQVIIQNLFSKIKVVKDAKFKTFLKSINYMNANAYEISGYQKDGEFSSSLTSYIDFVNILGEVNYKNSNMIEQIIYWLTIFEEKDIVARKIRSTYPENIISKSQMNKILKLRYKGWSNLSKKLLEGIYTLQGADEKVTVMNLLETTNLNLMQIINDKELSFKKIIEDYNSSENNEEITIEDVRELQGSPAIKKGIWQTVKIVSEIIKIMGHEPQNIFIEFAREDGDKRRTTTRLSQLKKSYEKMSNEVSEYNKSVAKELTNKKYMDQINSEKLYLYFTQNGKCMYSGKTLDIDHLSDYQVDHIIPRTYIKDDSIENKVLVLSLENQYKSDKLLIDGSIRNKQKYFWNVLYKIGLIGAKKYNNLLREGISENEAKGFINRQLVETRQISKHVAILFKDRYVNSNVATIKADLNHNFREKYALAKCRDLNDYHHAHDAFISATIGNYIMQRFPNMDSELIYGDFKKYYSKGKTNRENKYGYILSLFDYDTADNDGVVIWNGSTSIEYVKKAMSFKDCRVTKKLEEQTGAFYKETIYTKASTEAKIPIKKGLDVKKYGGYTGQNIAYSVVVEYLNKKKLCKKLIGIPLRIAKMEEHNPECVIEYLCENLKSNDLKILKNKIFKYQLVEEDGNQFYLTSDAEVINAKQLCFEKGNSDYINVLSKCFENKYKLNEVDDFNIKLEEILIYLKNKLNQQYPAFDAATNKIFDKIQFDKLELEAKIELVRELLKLSAANAQYPNLKKYDLADRMGRKANYNLDIDKSTFISQSITGLFEKRETL